MFNPITRIRLFVAVCQELRHENEATERMQNEQRVRVETMNYLSRNGLLKDGVG